jgi:hypothetical protein
LLALALLHHLAQIENLARSDDATIVIREHDNNLESFRDDAATRRSKSEINLS